MKSMRTRLLATLVIVLTMGGLARGQSASEQMKEAGSSAESAVSHAYHGTVTAIDDTALTAKVKARSTMTRQPPAPISTLRRLRELSRCAAKWHRATYQIARKRSRRPPRASRASRTS